MTAERIRINRTVSIPASDVVERFSPSGRPGGQHANKASTRVELTFDVAASRGLRPDQKERVRAKVGPVLRVVVDDERSQSRNRDTARRRFRERLADALKVPKARRATRPSRGAVERRLGAKRRRSETKASRRKPTLEG